ncbi:CoA-binding protein [Phyllobacterium sp. SYP-B3895]|uniref:CoA-binding protein n=1 Tax=Phyllobacterium sp. SYP-B3895 TaxID=2663240 RepID=UPI001299955F|nr:CoA-binding protein [Phyllobacterium sp. SYP-B3895]MRG55653.1 CoA-binding protein [Phyllobacterium sp. SYP-B3895]
MDHNHYSDSFIRRILTSVKTIALVGASPNESRPSNTVMQFLLAKGYKVFPVNPGHKGKQIHGQTVYARLADIPEPFDMVDVFRNSAALPALVDEVLALKQRPRIFWAQVGVRDEGAARKAETAGLTVVMDRCPAIEYALLGLDQG